MQSGSNKELQTSLIHAEKQGRKHHGSASGKRHSKRRNAFAPSPHLDFRLSIVESQSEDEDQQPQLQQETLADSPHCMSAVEGAVYQHCNSLLAAQQTIAAEAELRPKQQSDMQPQAQNLQQIFVQHQTQQQELLQDTVPATPDSGPLSSNPAANANVVPGTPDDDEEVTAEQVDMMPSFQQERLQCQQGQQKTGHTAPQGQQEFQFPPFADTSSTAVTPTMGIRSYSRTAAEQRHVKAPHEPGAEPAAYPPAGLRNAAVIASADAQVQQLPPIQQQQQPLGAVDASFRTPTNMLHGGAQHQSTVAAGAAGPAAASVVEQTPSTNKKGRPSPTESELMCGLLDSFERKQPKSSAAILPPVREQPAADTEKQLLSRQAAEADNPEAARNKLACASAAPLAEEVMKGDRQLTDRVEKQNRLRRWLDDLKEDTPVRMAASKLQQAAVHGLQAQQLANPGSRQQQLRQQQHQQQSPPVKKPLDLHQVEQKSGNAAAAQQQQQQRSTSFQQGNCLILGQPSTGQAAAASGAINSSVGNSKCSKDHKQYAGAGLPNAGQASALFSADQGHSGQVLAGVNALPVDTDMQLLPASGGLASAAAVQLQQQQQLPEPEGQIVPRPSPAGLSDVSGNSGSRPSSAGGLTPNTLAALEAIEEQYMQQKGQAKPPQLQPVAELAEGAGGIPTANQAGKLPSTCTADQQLTGVQDAGAVSATGKPPRAPVPALQPAAAYAQAAKHGTAQHRAVHVQQQVDQASAREIMQQQQQPGLPGQQQLQQRQQQLFMHQSVQAQHHHHQQVEQAEGVVSLSPSGKRRRSLPGEQRHVQQHDAVNSPSVPLFGDSPLPAKVLFENVVPDSNSGPQMKQLQRQQWQQQKPDSMQQPSCRNPDFDGPVQVVKSSEIPVALQHQQNTGAATSTAVTEAAAGVERSDHAAAQDVADARTEAATHVGNEESSDETDEEDDLGATAGFIYSQAAAVARIMRESQRLQDKYNKQQLQLQEERREQQQQDMQQLASQIAAHREEKERDRAERLTQAPAAAAAANTEQGAVGMDLDESSDDSEEDYKLEKLLTASTGRAGATQRPEASQGGGDAPAASPPIRRADDPCDGFLCLTSYLPRGLVDVYHSLGLTRDLYQWQAECLNQPGVLEGRNLVYCAPTSGGKSLVAEIIMLRRLLTTGRPALLVLPYVALCAQKAAHLQRLLAPLGKEVRSLYGGMGGAPLTPNTGVIVCTIEKANLIVNKMLEDDTLGQLGSVVVDELHMVGDDDRGYLLELLLTKLRFATQTAQETDEKRKAEALQQLERHRHMMKAQQGHADAEEAPYTPSSPQMPSGQSTPNMGFDSQVQIIGMSATLPNVGQVANWLDAVLFQTDFRPVQLQQMIKIDNVLKDKQGQVIRQLDIPQGWDPLDKDHVGILTKETVDAGHSVLIFCCSKVQCEVTAKYLARLLTIPERPNPQAAVITDPETPGGIASSARESIVSELSRYKVSDSGTALKDVVARGVAWHHSGLNGEQRELVEKAFGTGAISVLCATSTVAAGVNMPVRRVIFKHSYIGQPTNPLDPTRYMQMSGRAGRAGIDTEGESILIANRGNIDQLMALMNSDSTPISSCLVETRRGMKRAMLEVVAAGVVSSSSDVERYLKCSLLAAIEDYKNVAVTSTQDALKWLESKKFLEWNRDTGSWAPTDLGKATASSGLNPEQALLVKKDLENARMGLCLATDLHLTYLVTPVHDLLDLQRHHWDILYDVVNRARGPVSKVIEFVGLSRNYLHQRRMGVFRSGVHLNEKQLEEDRVARRFYAALVIVELISNDKEPGQVAQEYALALNVVEGLQERTGSFAHTVTSFCERYHWTDLESLIAKFQNRVCHGVRAELVALTEIPYVKGVRAKVLYKAGLRTPEAVATADKDRLFEILLAATPNAGNGPDAQRQRKKEKKAAYMISEGAKALVAAKARELEEQSEALKAAAAGGTAATPGSHPASLSVPKSPPSVSRFRARLQQQQQASQAVSSQHLNGQAVTQQAPQQQQQSQQLMPPPHPRQVTQLQQPQQQQQLGLQQNRSMTNGSELHQQQMQQQQQLLPPHVQHTIQQQQGHACMQQSHMHAGRSEEQQCLGQECQHHLQLAAPQQTSIQQGGQALHQHQHTLQTHGVQQVQDTNHQQQQVSGQHSSLQGDQLQLLLYQHGYQQQLAPRQAVDAATAPWQRKRSGSSVAPLEHPAKRMAGPPAPVAAASASTLVAVNACSGSDGRAAHAAADGDGTAWAAAAASKGLPPVPTTAAGSGAAAAASWGSSCTAPRDNSGCTAVGSTAAVDVQYLPHHSKLAAVSGSAAGRSSATISGVSGGSWHRGPDAPNLILAPADGKSGPQLQQCKPQQAGIGDASGAAAASNGCSSGAAGISNSRRSSREQQSDTSGAQISAAAIRYVRTAAEMQQLEEKLSSAPCWGFAVSLDSDVGAANNSAGLLGAEWKVPVPKALRERCAAGGSNSSDAAGVDTLGVEDSQQQQVDQQQQHTWKWNVIGVAFSLGDNDAYYVPLLSSAKSSRDAGISDITQRSGTSARLRSLWEGIRRIFTASSSSSNTGRKGGIAAVRAAGKAVNLMLAAARSAGTSTAAVPAEAAPRCWLEPGPVKVTYALKHQMALLAHPPAGSGLEGLVVGEPLVDVRLAAWLLEPDREDLLGEDKHGIRPGQRPLSKGLEELLKKWAGSKGIKDAIGGFGSIGEAGKRAVPACRKACMALKLHKLLITMLHGEALIPVLMGIEMPLVNILAAMETQGIAISAKVLQDQKPAMEKRLKQLEAEAQQYNSGMKFNLASPAEVRTVLFDRLKLPPPPCAQSKNSKKLSTKAEVLEELAAQHELPRIIIQHRKLSKICSSFLEPLVQRVLSLQKASAAAAAAAAKLGHSMSQCHSALIPAGATADHVVVSPEAAKELVRICGSFLQTNTSTGRLSMEEPSLQTIPRPLDYELAATPASQAATAADDAGKGGGLKQQQVNIRAAFVAPPGCVLLSADYCQIELRLMAHFSEDPKMLAALATGDDPFKELAAQWRKCSLQQVTPDMRNQAKRLAYGLLYGMGPTRLAVDLACSIPEAYALADDFQKSHEGLSAWIKNVIDGCHATTWVTTLSGRRRYLPMIRGKGEQVAQAERQAVNTVCQGSAADIVKGVMIDLVQHLASNGLGQYCRLLLQVHDELLFEISEHHLAAAATFIRQVMESASTIWGLKVKLPVKLSVGPSWGQLQEYID